MFWSLKHILGIYIHTNTSVLPYSPIIHKLALINRLLFTMVEHVILQLPHRITLKRAWMQMIATTTETSTKRGKRKKNRKREGKENWTWRVCNTNVYDPSSNYFLYSYSNSNYHFFFINTFCRCNNSYNGIKTAFYDLKCIRFPIK